MGVAADAARSTRRTTFVFANAAEVVAYNEGRSSKYLYSRYGNPTLSSVERQFAALDQAEAALVFSSGMGAITTTLMAHARAGDEVVCSAAIYGGTLHLLNDVLVKFGVRPRFVSLEELGEPERIIGDATRIVWFESPINPTLRCVDVRRIAAACRARGVLSVIDNTFASPINQQPLSLGVDLSMQSATKYLNGHSDVTGGVVTGAPRLVGADRARAPAARHADGSVSRVRARPRPENAAAAHRAAQRQRARGRAVPRRRQTRLLVYYPGPAVASRSRDRQPPDDRIRRDGLLRPGRGVPPRRAAVRPLEGGQARRQPWRHRKPDQPAGADVAVGPLPTSNCVPPA